MSGLGFTEWSPGLSQAPLLPACPTGASEEALGWAVINLQTFQGFRQKIQDNMKKTKSALCQSPCRLSSPASV